MFVHSLCVFPYVISDRSLEFVLNFFHSLGTALNMWLHFTLGYYPEGNVQTEPYPWAIPHVYCNYQQGNCSELLLLVKFSYNNTLGTITSVSLFFANKRYHLNITIHSEHNIASS